MKALPFPKCLLFSFVMTLLGLLALGQPEPAGGREIAILKSADIDLYNEAITGFKAETPLKVTYREFDLEGNFERGRVIAKKLRASDASVVFAVGLKAALAARLEIPDIPVVFCMVLDPEKYDLSAPNLKGITLEIPIAQQFSALKSVLPDIKKVGVLYDESQTANLVEQGKQLARERGLELLTRQVASRRSVPHEFRKLIGEIDALWLVPDRTVLTQESLKFLLRTALDKNVPVIGFSSEFVRSGALVGLSVSYEGVGRQAGRLASGILMGHVAIDTGARAIPPEQVRISLNLKTAEFLGITIPSQVVSRADEVY